MRAELLNESREADEREGGGGGEVSVAGVSLGKRPNWWEARTRNSHGKTCALCNRFSSSCSEHTRLHRRASLLLPAPAARSARHSLALRSVEECGSRVTITSSEDDYEFSRGRVRKYRWLRRGIEECCERKRRLSWEQAKSENIRLYATYGVRPVNAKEG